MQLEGELVQDDDGERQIEDGTEQEAFAWVVKSVSAYGPGSSTC